MSSQDLISTLFAGLVLGSFMGGLYAIWCRAWKGRKE